MHEFPSPDSLIGPGPRATPIPVQPPLQPGHTEPPEGETSTEEPYPEVLGGPVNIPLPPPGTVEPNEFLNQPTPEKPWERPPSSAEEIHTSVAQRGDLAVSTAQPTVPPVPVAQRGGTAPEEASAPAVLPAIPLHGPAGVNRIDCWPSAETLTPPSPTESSPPGQPSQENDTVGALPRQDSFAVRFSVARTERGMNQKQAAEACGFTSQTIVSQIENNRINWLDAAKLRQKKYVEHTNQLIRVAAFLQCTVAELLS